VSVTSILLQYYYQLLIDSKQKKIIITNRWSKFCHWKRR
jgi:hypothetical protein